MMQYVEYGGMNQLFARDGSNLIVDSHKEDVHDGIGHVRTPGKELAGSEEDHFTFRNASIRNRFSPSVRLSDYLEFPTAGESRLMSPEAAAGTIERNNAALFRVIVEQRDRIPFFAASGVTATALENLFQSGERAPEREVFSLKQKALDPNILLADFYIMAHAANQEWVTHQGNQGPWQTQSGGILLLDMHGDVSVRPTWSPELGGRVDVDQLHGARLLEPEVLQGHGQYAARIQARITAEKVVGIIPCESFAFYVKPEESSTGADPLLYKFADQLVIGRSLEAFLR